MNTLTISFCLSLLFQSHTHARAHSQTLLSLKHTQTATVTFTDSRVAQRKMQRFFVVYTECVTDLD